MLPRIELKPTYDRIVWLYLFRDFSGSDADLAAERVCLRLGFTSYPQHHLIHPESLERLTSTGRSIESFLAAVGRTKVNTSPTDSRVDSVRMADTRAALLKKSGSVGQAEKALADDDVLVRIRAVEILAEKKPGAIAKRAEALLETPNDPLRYAVCKALEKAGDLKGARALEAVAREPRDSLNPNVLRIHAVRALGACGDANSLEAIGPHAASGVYFNGLTGIAIQAVVAIAKRHPRAARAARDCLVGGYPVPTKEGRAKRACEALAKKVHDALGEVTGKRVPFPSTYDEAARVKLRKAW